MPSFASIIALAQQWGVDPLVVFAFAGAYNRVPNNQNELDTFTLVLTPVSGGDRLDLNIIYGYLQESRANINSIVATPRDTITSWAQTRGYFDVNNNLVFSPVPGSGYPNGQNVGTNPGGSPGPTFVPPASTSSSSPIGNITLPTLPTVGGQQIQLWQVGVGIAALYVGARVLKVRL
jgi:hypothetical protein